MRAISERTLGDEGGFFADPYSALFFFVRYNFYVHFYFVFVLAFLSSWDSVSSI